MSVLDITVPTEALPWAEVSTTSAGAEQACAAETVPFDGWALARVVLELPGSTPAVSLASCTATSITDALSVRGGLVVNAAGRVGVTVGVDQVVQPAGRQYALASTDASAWVAGYRPNTLTVTMKPNLARRKVVITDPIGTNPTPGPYTAGGAAVGGVIFQPVVAAGGTTRSGSGAARELRWDGLAVGGGGVAPAGRNGSASGTFGWGGSVSGFAPSTGTSVPTTPISTATPLFASASNPQSVNPSLTTLTGPMPTNAWFENLIMGTGAQPVATYPYEIKANTAGLDICVPALNTSNANAVLATFLGNLSLRSVQAITTRKVIGYTDLGVSVQWVSSGAMSADLVRGMAYVTMNYTALTPQLVTIHAITAINGTAVGASGSFTGTKFKLTMNNGQTWLIYASSSITLNLSTANTLTATAGFTGSIRAAYLPGPTAEAALDTSRSSVATGGSISYAVASSTATMTYQFTQAGSGPLLTYAMPHHQAQMTPAYATGMSVAGLRGTVRAVTGASWVLTVPLPTVGWDNAGTIRSDRVAAIQTALTTDRAYVPDLGDPYFGGKHVAKSAHLALIADRLGNTAARDQLLAAMKPVLTAYLNSTGPVVLRYDTVWGGIVSTAGLADPNADFGNAAYNDHHFHYGYALYAAAVVGKFDAAWITANQARVNDLVRDIANPSTSDPYFTKLRNMDLFEEHSWAAGIFEFGDGRNQESTSEAVNAWYGLYLWGLITGQTQIRDLGRFLLGVEIVGAQTYWQMKQADTIYPQPFRAHGAVGIVWSCKVDYATFFDADEACIHGIQMLPNNPSTEVLVPLAWSSETWPNNLLPLWTRSSVWHAELVSGGSGYVPQQVSPTGQGYTNGLAASGGTGSGLIFNVNMTAGRITEVFIVFDQHGTGYTEGDVITLNGSGGTGATVRVHTAPVDSWKGILLGGTAKAHPDDAWTRAVALNEFDDGSSRTQLLTQIATQG